MYDYALWTEIDATAKWHLTSLYGPYLLLCEFLSNFLSFVPVPFPLRRFPGRRWIDIQDGLGFGG